MSHSFTLSFTPSSLSQREADLQITSNDEDEGPMDVPLTGTGSSTETLFVDAMTEAGLSGVDAELDADPFASGVSNFLKFAFNMDLSRPDTRTLSPGGTSGLPASSLDLTSETPVWKIEFVQRTDLSLNYTALKTTDLSADFIPISVTPEVTGIDGPWQRVILEEPSDPAAVTSFFTRVSVTTP